MSVAEPANASRLTIYGTRLLHSLTKGLHAIAYGLSGKASTLALLLNLRHIRIHTVDIECGLSVGVETIGTSSLHILQRRETSSKNTEAQGDNGESNHWSSPANGF
jgi:hypothetical protein